MVNLKPMKWQTPPHTLALAPETLHLWLAPLTADEARESRYAASLSEEERARAERLPPEIRAMYIQSHGILRALLSRYSDIAPQALHYTYGPNQKPALENSALQFNMTHSGRYALYAFCLQHETGVDIEQHADRNILALAERYFTPPELDALNKAAPSQQQALFFQLWTQKEALIKAFGLSVQSHLHCFDLDVSSKTPLKRLDNTLGDKSEWRIIPIETDAEYTAAVAYHASVNTVTPYYFYHNATRIDSRNGDTHD